MAAIKWRRLRPILYFAVAALLGIYVTIILGTIHNLPLAGPTPVNIFPAPGHSSNVAAALHKDYGTVRKTDVKNEAGNRGRIKGFNKHKYSPITCAKLLNEAEEQSKIHLQKYPELQPPEYDPVTGKNESYNIRWNDQKYKDVISNVLDPNMGTQLLRRDANGHLGPKFAISLHRPQIDPLRWGLYTKGEYYERLNTQHFIDILSSETNGDTAGAEKGIVVDVGMNIGFFTLLSAALGRRVVSFDPNPLHHVRICQSLLANGWYVRPPLSSGEKNFVHVEGKPTVGNFLYGLGAVNDFLALSYQMNELGSATLVEKNHKAFTKIKVEVLKLDVFAVDQGWMTADGERVPSAMNEFPISLLKVDVEGFEKEVFEGAQNLLRSGIVKFILAEYTFVHSGEAFKQAVWLTADAGYRLVFVGDGLGGFGGFKKIMDKWGGFPINSNIPDYPSVVSQWVFNFMQEESGKKFKACNLMWVRNGVSTEGLFHDF